MEFKVKFENRNNNVIAWQYYFENVIIHENMFIMLREHLLNDWSFMYLVTENR
jgi:hypothetical protein